MNIKYKKRIIKKVVIIFAILLNIIHFTLYASINDGSSFITKSEFDNMRAQFQTVINQYNISIDRKIEDGIAEYLKGIVSNNETDDTLLFANWGKVTSMNFLPENEWKLMDLDLTYNYLQYAYLNTSGWAQNTWGYAI